jgi:hypothetical protein
MPCAECEAVIDSWESISWHPCESYCVNPETWVVTLPDSQQDVRCSRSWDGSYWFFYCSECKDAARPAHVLRGAYICMRQVYGVPRICYETDSDNESDFYSDSS